MSGGSAGRTVPVVAVVGYKNTGKTTLISRLIAAFKAEGLRVGACKHDGAHDFDLDVPGTDSWHHRQAGADVTLLASRTHAALQVFYAEEPPLEKWLGALSAPELALDLILVEGWKRSDLPKIVLLGSGTPYEEIEQYSNVLCCAADCQSSSIAEGQMQVYDREDIEAIIRLIRACVLTQPDRH